MDIENFSELSYKNALFLEVSDTSKEILKSIIKRLMKIINCSIHTIKPIRSKGFLVYFEKVSTIKLLLKHKTCKFLR